MTRQDQQYEHPNPSIVAYACDSESDGEGRQEDVDADGKDNSEISPEELMDIVAARVPGAVRARGDKPEKEKTDKEPSTKGKLQEEGKKTTLEKRSPPLLQPESDEESPQVEMPSLHRHRPTTVARPGAFNEVPGQAEPASSEPATAEPISPTGGRQAQVVQMPQAVPISAELAEAEAGRMQELEAQARELEAKTQEIERLKRNLENLNQQIHVAAPVDITEIDASATSHSQQGPHMTTRHSAGGDIAKEIENFVLDPSKLERTPSAPGTCSKMTANKLQFASLGLIGRNQEQDLLGECLDRASREKSRELILISGESGTGKTALAMTLQKKVLQERGLFISGKFDLYLRDEPYAGISSACGELCRDLSSIEEISREIVRELGSELPILVKILPELQSIVGNSVVSAEQDLGQQGLEECKKQIAYAFRRFFRVICSFFPSLVLCLDDIQWADLASLDLLESLVTDDKMSSLVVVGCYRSNEVDETHLVSKTIRELQANSDQEEAFHITHVSIGNLDLSSVHELLMDLLSMEEGETLQLAKVCYKKTHGNVFFLLQFLSHIYHENLLEYSWLSRKWTWTIEEVTSKTGSTSNVVDLLKNKMKTLSSKVVQLLPILACLGCAVEISVLVIVWHAYCGEDDDESQIEPLLASALEEGFIEKQTVSTYQFVHDKIQEATLTLVECTELQEIKSTVGNVLATKFEGSTLEAHLFVAVNLLNEGTGPNTLDDCLGLAYLNLRAGKKAVEASAFASASKYFMKGIGLLPSNKWATHYNLTLELFSLVSEVQGYLGQVESMECHCNEVLANAKCLPDTFQVQNCLQDSYLNRHLNEEALQHGLDLLKKLGYKFAKGKNSIALSTVTGLVSTKLQINSGTAKKIESLPLLTDPVKIQIMHTLDKCCTAAYLLMHDIFALLIFKSVQLTLSHGLTQYAPPAFSFLACIFVGGLSDFDNAAMLISCVEKMMEKPENRNTASRTAFVSSCLVLPWVDPSQNCLKKLVSAYYQGLSTGDTDSSMWAINVYIGLGLQSGRKLGLLEADCTIYIKQMLEFERVKIAKFTQMYSQVLANLTGNFGASDCKASWPIVGLDEDLYNDDEIMVDLGKEFHNRLCAILGEHSRGAELSIARGDSFLKGAPGCYHHIPDAFHRAVSLFAMARETNQRKYIRHAQKQRALIKMWTKKGNPNTIHYKALLDAENAALKKRPQKAKELYQTAIATGIRLGFVQDAALAGERYAEFLLRDLDDRECALIQVEEAIRLYTEWGATRKVEMLEKKYSSLRQGA